MLGGPTTVDCLRAQGFRRIDSSLTPHTQPTASRTTASERASSNARHSCIMFPADNRESEEQRGVSSGGFQVSRVLSSSTSTTSTRRHPVVAASREADTTGRVRLSPRRRTLSSKPTNSVTELAARDQNSHAPPSGTNACYHTQRRPKPSETLLPLPSSSRWPYQRHNDTQSTTSTRPATTLQPLDLSQTQRHTAAHDQREASQNSVPGFPTRTLPFGKPHLN